MPRVMVILFVSLFIVGCILNKKKSDESDAESSSASTISYQKRVWFRPQNVVISSSNDIYIGGYVSSYDYSGSRTTNSNFRTLLRKSQNLGVSFERVFNHYDTDRGGGFILNSSSEFIYWDYPLSIKSSDGDHWSPQQGDLSTGLEDFQMTPEDFFLNGDGKLYAAAYTRSQENGKFVSYLWRSLNEGNSWTLLGTHQVSSDDSTYIKSIKGNSDHKLFMAVNSETRGYLPTWRVWTTSDDGDNWSELENYILDDGDSEYCQISDLKIDSQNNIYTVGMCDSTDGNRWIVRKSSDNGIHWENVDSYATETSGEFSYNYAFAYALTIDSDDNIYVVGESMIAVDQYSWVVKKSSDGGATWTELDSYLYGDSGSSSGAIPQNIAVGGENNELIVVIGYAFNGSKNVGHRSDAWVVRTSTDSGETWTNSEVLTDYDKFL